MVKTMEGSVKNKSSEDDVQTSNLSLSDNDGNNAQNDNNNKSTPIKSKAIDPKNSPVKSKSPLKLLTSDIWTCEICKADSSSDNPKARIQWMECDRCSVRFHRNCTDLNNKQFKFIHGFPTKNLEWVCNRCLNDKDKGDNTNKQAGDGDQSSLIVEQNKKIIDQNCKILEQQALILDLLKDKKEGNNKVDKQIKVHVEETLQEMKEKEEKKMNMILHGIPEGTEEEEAKNKETDVNKTKAVLTYVNPEVKLTIDPSKVQRIGKKGTKPRPVKVVLDSVETKMQFIRNSKKLKDHDTFSKVGLSFDKTKREQEEYRRLKEKLDEKNRNEGSGADYQIFRGNIVLKTEVAKILRKYKEQQGTGWASASRPDGGNSGGPNIGNNAEGVGKAASGAKSLSE